MKLAAYLSAHSISDADFADKIGVDRTSVSRMRRNGQVPSAEVMRSIVRETAGAVTPNDFFGVVTVAADRAA